MKRLMTILVFAQFMCGMAQGVYTYTYGPGTNFGAKTLENTESMLVYGGGGGSLTLFGASYARIESTPPLGTDYGGGVWAGGIWNILITASTTLDVLGGEIGEIRTGDSGHASLYGGRIVTLQSVLQGPWAGGKYIDLYCKDYFYNSTTGMLTGTWGNDSAFSIQLVNISGYSPTIDNVNFIIIPEPASLALFGLGGAVWAGFKRRLA